MKKILIINIGSASKKMAFYQEERLIVSAHYEKENGGFILTREIILADKSKEKRKEEIAGEDFAQAIKKEMEFLKERKIIENEKEISAVGFRVVCPGEYFLATKEINSEYLEKLAESLERAPLHIEPTLNEIKKFKNDFPSILMMAVSDSGFFSNLPMSGRYYGLPKDLAEKYEIKRFGYHGLSAESINRKLAEGKWENLKKIIICHLGSGCSVMAIDNGQPTAMSMGFTPLEGLVMATRAGDIDFGAVSYLAKKENLDYAEMNDLLNKKSGLLGLAGTEDMREIIKRKEMGEPTARLAFNVFVERVRKYIGASLISLGGLDAIIFTGAMGERSDIVRSAVLDQLDFLGLSLDEEKNRKITLEGSEGFVEKNGNKIKIAVFSTDEMGEMAIKVKAVLL